jgi:Methyltransferase domain/Domain of unknown function (DUF4214)
MVSSLASQNSISMSRDEAKSLLHTFYFGILRRTPDALGLEHFTTLLLNGSSPASIAEEFVSSDEFKALTSIKLFAPAGHFYSPVVHPLVATDHYDALEAAGAVNSVPGIAIDRIAMLNSWMQMLPFMASNPFPTTKTPECRYAFDNPAYSWGDACVLHAMLRLHRPKQLIEIGSGWSSACTLDTVERYLENECAITFIEPYPELLQSLVGNCAQGVARIIEKPVQKVPVKLFEELECGDFLFIDSTHLLSTGSDVCYELFDILPRLRSGVFVHFHDVFWPFEYPRSWAVNENRSWNELYALRLMLTNSREWEIAFFNDYFAKNERDQIEHQFANFLLNSGGALWLRRV